ncbi:hypothetical protein QYQ99_22335 [Comamonas testosteroni]|uniref:hypothetical protein n=1 Tax=Comamonas testosteroni TaxID=285 RepID=UPI002660300C|nr:hypothetical protein [Comamonas testosteroni]WKL15071.1 hypothetical protein QYQ99_22335 [Comamonas testosteroni]
MSFINKTIFNIRSRLPVAKQDVESRNAADDDRIFHTPFQTDAQLQEESPEQMLRKKTNRLLLQAVLNKISAA